MTSTYPYCSPPGDGRQGYGHCLSNHDELSKITGYGLQPARPHHSPGDAAAPRAGVHRRNSPSSPWEAVKKYHWPLAGSSRSASHGSHGRSKLPAARLRGICTRNQMYSFQGSLKHLHRITGDVRIVSLCAAFCDCQIGHDFHKIISK